MLRAVLGVAPLPVLACALVACGSGAAPQASTPSTTETHPSAPVYVPEPEPPEVTPGSPITEAQRAAIEPLLARYGSGWRLENIESTFTVRVLETPTEYTLYLAAQGPSGLTVVVHATKDGHLENDALALPRGPELTAAQLAAAESIVRAEQMAWVQPYEGGSSAIPLAAGLAALLGDTPRESRMRDGAAVFYTRADEYGPLLVVVVDLAASRLSEVTWYDVPPQENGLLPREDIAAIDEAMRLHGDFGVYGSVSEGLVALARDQEIALRPTVRPGVYSVLLSPPGGHGHSLSFTVDIATRTLDSVAAGHTVSARPD